MAELMRKSTLRVQLRLLQLLRIDQPKLPLNSVIASPKPPAATPLELVWDPLTETLEAPPCPVCGKPTFVLEQTRTGIACPACAAATATRPGRR